MKSKHQGFTMLEIMVALIILSIGMLGIVGMQTTSMKYSNSSAHRSIAAWHMHVMAEAVRSNNVRAAKNQYTVANDDSAAPSGDDIIKTDVANWKKNIKATLPAGKGAIVMLTNPQRVQIIVSFDDSRAEGGSNEQKFSIEVEL